MNAAKNRNENGELLTYDQTAEKSNLGRNMVMRLARESGALVKIGRTARVDWQRFYRYITDVYSVGK